MDGDVAKVMLQAILTCAKGQVGSFVDLHELTAALGLGNAQANATFDDLVAHRWIYRNGDRVAASKPSVEYAIDWPCADTVLRAIATVAGSRAGKVVSYSQVITTAGLPADKTDELIAELTVLGLVAQTTSDGVHIDGVCLSREGWLRLSGSPAVG